jgi:hypothetical protein
MASYNSFSHKSRQEKDSMGNLFNSPHLIDPNKTNENKIKSFESVKPQWKELCSYFRYYPDHFIDFISPPDSKIKLYFYQRVYLRIMMRYRKVFVTATRGTSKSFLENLSFVLKCIFYPGTKLFITAPGKEQAAKISQDCLNDIFTFFPILREEVKTFIESKDYTKVIFHNGSRYDVVQTRDSTRGGRRNGGAIEEIADEKFNGDLLNSVVIPLMANDRIAMCGGTDPNEIHKSELYVTTAGTQQRFAYEKMSEVYQDMINGKSAFCVGNSYEMPCMHNQLDIDFVEELKDSPTFAIMDFMREYESIWTGSSSDSLVADDKLNESRTVGVAEFEHCGKHDVEYVLAYDVARNEGDANANSCLVVIKITPKGNGDYYKEVVNIFSMEGTHDLLQAKFLKEKVKQFQPRILVVDANGLGSGVVDQLVLQIDDNPPYQVINDERYDKYKLPDSIPILFALKAQNKETRESDMVNVFMKLFNKKGVRLLKSPHEGIKDLENKMKRKIKDSNERANLEVPYILTDVLAEEILNLRYRQAGNGTKAEQISKRIKKDKYSALLYGLYWIHLQEQKNKTIRKRESIDIDKLFMFKQPKIM